MHKSEKCTFRSIQVYFCCYMKFVLRNLTHLVWGLFVTMEEKFKGALLCLFTLQFYSLLGIIHSLFVLIWASELTARVVWHDHTGDISSETELQQSEARALTNGLFVCTLASLLERDRPPRTIIFVCSSIRVVVPEHKDSSIEKFNVVTSEVILQKTLSSWKLR